MAEPGGEAETVESVNNLPLADEPAADAAVTGEAAGADTVDAAEDSAQPAAAENAEAGAESVVE